jgi:hypothetical protein
MREEGCDGCLFERHHRSAESSGGGQGAVGGDGPPLTRRGVQPVQEATRGGLSMCSFFYFLRNL